MPTLDGAAVASVATAICMALVHWFTTRMDLHKEEAHELRDEVHDLRSRLDAAQKEAQGWRERFNECNEKEGP